MWVSFSKASCNWTWIPSICSKARLFCC